jgi:capsular polysaccharide biosynthesis protein
VEGRLYLRLFLRNRLPIAVLTVLALITGGVLYAIAPATFQSSLTFTVQSDAGSAEPSEVYQAELLSEARAQTYARLVAGPALAARLRAKMAVPVARTRLQDDISASVGQGSVLLRVTVTDGAAEVVDAASRALLTEFPAYVADLQPFGAKHITAVQVAAAPGPAEKTAPTKVRYLGLALLAGLLLGLLVAVIREAGNRRLRDADDVRSVAGPDPVVVELKGRSRARRRPDGDAAIVLSALIARAAARGRPVAFIPLLAGRRAAWGMFDLARRLATGGERLGIVDGDVDGGYLSAIADADAGVRVLDAEALSGTGYLPGTPSELILVPAKLVLALATDRRPRPTSSHADAELVAGAVDKAAAALGDLVDVVVVTTGSVLLRSRPALPSTEPAESVLLLQRGAATKTELATALDVLAHRGGTVGAIALFGDTLRWRPR